MKTESLTAQQKLNEPDVLYCNHESGVNMAEDQHKTATSGEVINWQIVTGTVLQIPAAIAAVAFFFGTASILGKLIAVPSLARQLSVTDVISEAILTTPPFLLLWIATIAIIHSFGENLPTEQNIKRIFRYIYRTLYICAPLSLVFGFIPNLRIIAAATLITGYICIFFTSALAIAVKYRNGKPKAYFLFVPVLSTFVLILLISTEITRYAREYPDDRIHADSLEVCIERCHPGLVIASTSTLSAIRYWGSNAVYLVPNSDIKSQKVSVRGNKWESSLWFGE